MAACGETAGTSWRSTPLVSPRWRRFKRSTPGARARPPPASSVRRRGRVHGPRDVELRWASVTKLLTGLAVLVAVEEGTVDLDEPAGPAGSTLRHLLAHASGLAPEEGPPLMPPGQRRIYSNSGIELAAALVAERAGMPFAEYLRAAVVAAARARRRAARLARVGLPRPARRSARARARAARADARRARDARRGDVGAVPRPRRRAAGLGADGAERLGARVRAARREVAALDGNARLAAHVRPLRRGRDVPLGRSGRRASRAASSPTASSATGRRRPGRRSATQSSANSGRSSSSNVARSQLATTAGVIAVTVAVRGTSIASATSPK